MSATSPTGRKRPPSRAEFQPLSPASRRRNPRSAPKLPAPPEAAAADDPDHSWAIHRGPFPGDRAG